MAQNSLRILREAAGYSTIGELALVAGINAKTLGNFERGTGMSAAKIAKVAAVLKVSPAEILKSPKIDLGINEQSAQQIREAGLLEIIVKCAGKIKSCSKQERTEHLLEMSRSISELLNLDVSYPKTLQEIAILNDKNKKVGFQSHDKAGYHWNSPHNEQSQVRQDHDGKGKGPHK